MKVVLPWLLPTSSLFSKIFKTSYPKNLSIRFWNGAFCDVIAFIKYFLLQACVKHEIVTKLYVTVIL